MLNKLFTFIFFSFFVWNVSGQDCAYGNFIEYNSTIPFSCDYISKPIYFDGTETFKGILLAFRYNADETENKLFIRCVSDSKENLAKNTNWVYSFAGGDEYEIQFTDEPKSLKHFYDVPMFYNDIALGNDINQYGKFGTLKLKKITVKELDVKRTVINSHALNVMNAFNCVVEKDEAFNELRKNYKIMSSQKKGSVFVKTIDDKLVELLPDGSWAFINQD